MFRQLGCAVVLGGAGLGLGGCPDNGCPPPDAVSLVGVEVTDEQLGLIEGATEEERCADACDLLGDIDPVEQTSCSLDETAGAGSLDCDGTPRIECE